MKPLYTEEEFNQAKSKDLLKLECYNCQKTFNVNKGTIKSVLKLNPDTECKFCSGSCSVKFRHPRVLINCKTCETPFLKLPNQFKKTKNHFCCSSCAAKYTNTHKTKGTRRSKLEKWLEIKLTEKYPALEIHFNKKGAVNSELDIYVPILNIAFELNGIFHYEPIFGVNKLQSIQNNDNLKSKLCFEAKIDLCIIDVSKQKYFKDSTSQKYLDIITNIIDSRLIKS